jgi:hypothetical protein
LKIRHYLLVLLTLLAIAFLQPLVLLFGGVTLLAGVMAFIYSDLPPERQDAWEMKLSDWFGQLRSTLRGRSRREALAAGSRSRAMTSGRSGRPARLAGRPLPPTDSQPPPADSHPPPTDSPPAEGTSQSPVEPWH